MEAGGDFILGLPGWVAMAIIPFGYALIMIHFALKTIEQAAVLLLPQKEKGS